MRDTRKEIVEIYIRECLNFNFPIKCKIDYLVDLKNIKDNIHCYDIFLYPEDLGSGMYNFFWWYSSEEGQDYYLGRNRDSEIDGFNYIPNGVDDLINEYREWRESQ